MKDKVLRKLFLGFIQLHILHHACKEPVFGLWMMEELQEHGYEISAGTLYPIFHNLEKSGLLYSIEKVIDGKVRKYYQITAEGEEVLKLAKEKAMELIDELE
ncbi:DNA-binding PadR family transcriptional regulator [Anaerosolibacter carboniphilus]|uniref:DNA-binding PadR family transcriptional regulator n=1 Tax=Anaerosolibacter carboniphilus TaxID=1417629 RepID=A0A841L1F3_9FIRM|nr:PadR family transcriptional regulator [Anaerosolibacter carboniphilus]MBB6216195.1 DNA-binding PadR family transcriptional regulator [Anaerosolibacter carboniphilus]